MPQFQTVTVFWIENHGRHGVPWNGRNRCLGLEDVCSYVNEGMPISAQPNDINAQGIPTAIELAADRPTVVNYIQGVAKIPPDFRMVKDIELGAGEVTFVSGRGEKVSLPRDFEFARTGKLSVKKTHSVEFRNVRRGGIIAMSEKSDAKQTEVPLYQGKPHQGGNGLINSQLFQPPVEPVEGLGLHIGVEFVRAGIK